jgi:hypothetical protein
MLALFLLFSGLVMLLWNAVIPAIFGAGSISYLQAAGLLALCRILFGGISLGGFRDRLMRDHFRNMSPEQRDKFARRMREGFHPRDLHEAFHCWHGGEEHAPDEKKSPDGNA